MRETHAPPDRQAVVQEIVMCELQTYHVLRAPLSVKNGGGCLQIQLSARQSYHYVHISALIPDYERPCAPPTL